MKRHNVIPPEPKKRIDSLKLIFMMSFAYISNCNQFVSINFILYLSLQFDSEFNIQEKHFSTLPQPASFGSRAKSRGVALSSYSGYMSCFCLYDKVLKPFQIEALEFCPNRQGKYSCYSFKMVSTNNVLNLTLFGI